MEKQSSSKKRATKEADAQPEGASSKKRKQSTKTAAAAAAAAKGSAVDEAIVDEATVMAPQRATAAGDEANRAGPIVDAPIQQRASDDNDGDAGELDGAARAQSGGKSALAVTAAEAIAQDAAAENPEEGENDSTIDEYMSAGHVYGRQLCTRLVDVRHGIPLPTNRPIEPTHVQRFIDEFEVNFPQYRTRLIVVSVDNEEDMVQAEDPTDFDWKFTIEAGNHRCQAWKKVWETMPEKRQRAFARDQQDHDANPRPLWTAIVMYRENMQENDQSLIRVNAPEIAGLEDDIETTLLHIREMTGDKPILSVTNTKLTAILKQMGYSTINATHLRKIVRVKEGLNDEWQLIVDNILTPSMSSNHKGTLKKGLIELFYAVFRGDEDDQQKSGKGKGKGKKKAGTGVDWHPYVLAWLREPIQAGMDRSLLFSRFSTAMRTLSSTCMPSLSTFWSRMTLKQKQEFLKLRVTTRAQQDPTRQSKPKNKKATQEPGSSDPVFYLDGFAGADLAAQAKQMVKYLLNQFAPAQASQQSTPKQRTPKRRSPAKQNGGQSAGQSSQAAGPVDGVDDQSRHPPPDDSDDSADQGSPSQQQQQTSEEPPAVRGVVVNGSVFDFFAKMSDRLLAAYQHQPHRSNDRQNSIVVAADIPYFLGVAEWDQLEFALPGCESEETFCAHFAMQMFAALSQYNVQGFIFCSHDQSSSICKTFKAIKETLPDEVSLDYTWGAVKRTNYQASGNMGYRKCLMANSECFVQFVVNNPTLEYVGLFKDRSHILDVPWTKPGDYLKTGKLSVNPTQKPVKLWSDLIKSVPSCGLVLDLFAGTGSASVAAVEQLTDFIAVEITDQVWQISARIKKAFGGPPKVLDGPPKVLDETHKLVRTRGHGSLTMQLMDSADSAEDENYESIDDMDVDDDEVEEVAVDDEDDVESVEDGDNQVDDAGDGSNGGEGTDDNDNEAVDVDSVQEKSVEESVEEEHSQADDDESTAGSTDNREQVAEMPHEDASVAAESVTAELSAVVLTSEGEQENDVNAEEANAPEQPETQPPQEEDQDDAPAEEEPTEDDPTVKPAAAKMTEDDNAVATQEDDEEVEAVILSIIREQEEQRASVSASQPKKDAKAAETNKKDLNAGKSSKVLKKMRKDAALVRADRTSQSSSRQTSSPQPRDENAAAPVVMATAANFFADMEPALKPKSKPKQQPKISSYRPPVILTSDPNEPEDELQPSFRKTNQQPKPISRGSSSLADGLKKKSTRPQKQVLKSMSTKGADDVPAEARRMPWLKNSSSTESQGSASTKFVVAVADSANAASSSQPTKKAKKPSSKE